MHIYTCISLSVYVHIYIYIYIYTKQSFRETNVHAEKRGYCFVDVAKKETSAVDIGQLVPDAPEPDVPKSRRNPEGVVSAHSLKCSGGSERPPKAARRDLWMSGKHFFQTTLSPYQETSHKYSSGTNHTETRFECALQRFSSSGAGGLETVRLGPSGRAGVFMAPPVGAKTQTNTYIHTYIHTCIHT